MVNYPGGERRESMLFKTVLKKKQTSNEKRQYLIYKFPILFYGLNKQTTITTTTREQKNFI